jgi:hypothetical protein
VLPDLRAGIYRHYKGNLYQIIGYAKDANADTLLHRYMDPRIKHEIQIAPLGERIVVIYMGLELTDASRGPRMSIRTATDFFAPVCWNRDCDRFGTSGEHPATGYCSLCTAQHQPRFQYTGSEWR